VNLVKNFPFFNSLRTCIFRPFGVCESATSFLNPWDDLFSLAENCGQAFLPSYLPIIEKRASQTYSSKEREFQLYRRGRYVEFNLVWDRGTIFGLQTNGRTESILMSLPPLARWEYGYKARKNSREEFLTSIFTKPQDWLNDKELEKFCMENNIFD